MTNDLDRRARAGARALHDAVAACPCPRTSHHRSRGWPDPPRGRRAIVVGGAGCLPRRRRAADAGLSTDGSGPAPRLVLDPAPKGMTILGVADLPVAGETVVDGSYSVLSAMPTPPTPLPSETSPSPG